MGNSASSCSADTSMGNSWSSSLAGTLIKVVAVMAALGLAAWIFASSSTSLSVKAHSRNQQQKSAATASASSATSLSVKAHGRNQQQKSAATASAQQIHLQQEQDDPKPAPCDCLQGKAEVGEGAETIPVATSSGPAFKMSVPEDSLELDDDDDDEGDLSSAPLATAEDGSDTQTAEVKYVVSEAAIPENPHTSAASVDRFNPCAPSSFHFGSPPVPQNPVPFRPAGSVELTEGGFSSFSSEDGGSSGRKLLKVTRQRRRRRLKKD